MSPVVHIEVPGQPPAAAEVHVGRQIPSAPLVCFVRGGNVGAPAPKSRFVGSPVSQIHPVGQPLGVAPTTQSSVQKPEVPDPVAQKHAPLVVSVVVQASPGCFVRTIGVFGVHSPMSGSQL